MAQRFTVMTEKVDAFHFRGTCPMCDEVAEIGFYEESWGLLTRTFLKASVHAMRTAATFIPSPFSKGKELISSRLSSDGWGRGGLCSECGGLVIICSKCHAAWRAPVDLAENECPNCGARMLL